jgi:hypothetical protein
MYSEISSIGTRVLFAFWYTSYSKTLPELSYILVDWLIFRASIVSKEGTLKVDTQIIRRPSTIMQDPAIKTRIFLNPCLRIRFFGTTRILTYLW